MDQGKHKKSETRQDTLFSRMFEMGRLLQQRTICQSTVPLTTLHLGTLFHIKNTESTDMQSLAAFLRVSAPSVSRLVAGLEREKLLVRRTDTQDKRRTLLTLAPLGARMVNEVEQQHRDAFARIIEPLTKEQQQSLLEILTTIVNHAKR